MCSRSQTPPGGSPTLGQQMPVPPSSAMGIVWRSGACTPPSSSLRRGAAPRDASGISVERRPRPNEPEIQRVGRRRALTSDELVHHLLTAAIKREMLGLHSHQARMIIASPT